LTLPIHVVRLREKNVSLEGRTRDVSSGGAYFVVDADLNEGMPIEFFVTLQGGVSSLAKVRLRCLGRITRAEKTGEGGHLGVAATIDRYQFVRESLN
jgi:PilZ domain